MFVSPGGYICGEGSAQLEAIEGKRAEPRNKPPNSATQGLWMKPTALNNVETFANVPQILARGVEWFKSQGHHPAASGLKFVGISGDVLRPGVYEIPMGLPLSEVVFNLHRATATRQSTVIVVEGFFDCLKVYQAGFGSVVALMGSALYESQRRLLLQHFRRVILMLDGDAPGRRAAAVVSARLSTDCPVRIVQLGENRQPDQLSEQELRQLLEGKGGQPENH